MAFYTNRNNIKPMVGRITFVVVILFCWIWAVMALQGIDFRQLTVFNSFNNSVMSFTLLRMMQMKLLYGIGTDSLKFFCLLVTFYGGLVFFSLAMTLMSCFAFFALVITSLYIFAFLALHIKFSRSLIFFSLCMLIHAISTTYFAIILMTIFVGATIMKFRKWFDCFAFGTFFGYDLLSHNRLLIRRLRLEPYARPVRVSGLLYSNCTL